MNKKRKWIFAVIIIVLVISVSGYFIWSRLGYSGLGMMGGYGSGSGMMGYYSNNSSLLDTRLLTEDVEKRIKDYLLRYYDSSFYIEEIMDFSNNFYAQIGHQDEDSLAFELIINPYNGEISEEPGPNMMWNRKYGQMRWRYWNPNKKMTVSEKEAIEAARKYLDKFQPGNTPELEADRFNGYYTIHIINKQGEVNGMLSVNGYNSRVWFHNWHGAILNKDIVN